MNTISSVSSSNAYNPQITNKVAAANSTNLANNAANQSAFSSYIGQALAQIGVANPTNSIAPVVSGTNNANKNNSSEKSLGTFIQDLFSILSQKDSASQKPITAVEQQTKYQQNPNPNIERRAENEAESAFNAAAIAAYDPENSTTVGTLVGNLKSIIQQLNDTSRKTESDNLSALQALKKDFQSVLEAHGASSNNKASLGNFLQTLAQNLQGQSPLGIIVNAQA
jgi:hypothetical protein